MNTEQRRVTTVLNRLAALAETDEDFAEAISVDLDNLLNDIQGQDGFGTEAQCDPRGDFRHGVWTMGYVEGVDDENK